MGVAVAERINKCMKSDHYQVAERALLLWNNSVFQQLLKDDNLREPVTFAVIDSLLANAKAHWNQ